MPHSKVGDGGWRRCEGWILHDDAQVLVNAVNCEGLIEPGLDEAFAALYPYMTKAYRAACADEDLHPGGILPFALAHGRWVVCLAVKRFAHERTSAEALEQALARLVEFLLDKNITSIAVPPVGAGLGGLPWPEVEVLLQHFLSPLSDGVDIRIYPPWGHDALDPA